MYYRIYFLLHHTHTEFEFSLRTIQITFGLIWSHRKDIRTGNAWSAPIGTLCANVFLKCSLSQWPVQNVVFSFSMVISYSITGNGHKVLVHWIIPSFHSNTRPVADICNEKFFIDLDKETVFSRRIHRNYIPADPPGYFNQCVWPMYLKNKEELKDQPDISKFFQLIALVWFGLVNDLMAFFFSTR